MSNKQKMLVSDYDGTLFVNEEGIRNNVKAIEEFRLEKNLFVIATGNNWNDFQKIISKYGIKCDYLISDQGACIFDNKNNLLKATFLDYNISKKIINKIKQVNKNYEICNPHNEVKTIEENDVTKIAVNFGNLQEALNFNSEINKEFGEYVNAYTMIFEEINIVEIISSAVDKNEAIQYLMSIEKLEKEDVYTIGNGYNDISMIQSFNGYCMKNSVKELLEKCPNSVETVSDLIDEIKTNKSKVSGCQID